MQPLILALLIGLLCGRLLKGSSLIKHIPAVVLVSVALLLLIMGAKIGGNPEVISSLPRLGGKALTFAILSIAGGILLTLPLQRRNNT
ncbi:MAG: hypothetical protein DDT34_01765 [Firmicutes bacterium]|nr:hypothetical protein [Bacillota bacterium]MBT9152240.1 hypothetical protein [Bacillota bacterium]MBT9158591.1 hypothetical protein [Bacillota bacterium]